MGEGAGRPAGVGERSARRPPPGPGPGGDPVVGPGRPDELHAPRVPVGAGRHGRHRRAQVEQVGERRVGAQPGVGADRVGGDGGVRHGGGDDRQQQGVDRLPRRRGGGGQRPQAVEIGKGPPGGDVGRAADDRRHHRVEAAGRRPHEVADRGVPLGHEGAAVQQRARRQERRQVDLDESPALGRGQGERRVVGGGRHGGRRRRPGSRPPGPRPAAPASAPAGPVGAAAVGRDQGSSGSGPAAAATTAAASAGVAANTPTQSSDRQAGTTPAVLRRPRVGFSAAMPLSAAGTRPDPAVSVPRANGTTPWATTTADPELEPPDTQPGWPTAWQAP